MECRCVWRQRGRGAAFGLLGVVLGALLLPGDAAATFRVSPTILDLHRDPGQAALGTIQVEMERERDRRFRVVVQDIRQLPDGSQAYAPPSGLPFSASSWISVLPRRFAGGARRTQPIRYAVRVPANAEPGDHLASISVQRLPASGRATAAPVEAISVRLDVRVSGRAVRRARIAALDVPGLADGGPISIGATVRNTGNVILDFDRGDPGRVRIMDGSEPKATLPFEGRLYPGQTRFFDLSWDDPPLFGDFDAVASVDTGSRPARRTAKLWVIPWREIAALVLIVLAVLTVALGVRRRRWGY